jgi:lysophospholipase L1-like esterase
MKTSTALILLVLALTAPATSLAELDGKIQILLLGDSTTEASIPKALAPKEPQFEDVIRILLAAEGDLPPTNVINLGLRGRLKNNYARRLTIK